MWFFSSPQIVFGEQALSYLERLSGTRAAIVTDATLVRLGMVERIRQALAPTGMEILVIDQVEPDPSLETVRQGAARLCQFAPQWIIALGGGSVMDAAKAMWILYERPDIEPQAINPIEPLGLRAKARLAAIPTTTGTGSEATWAIVLTDHAERRKLGLGSREALPDVAILDPEIVAELPARLTADTGLDALTHAVEGFTSTFHNDFTDGLCLQAAKLVFEHLPACFRDGTDLEARGHLQNAATIAGLGFGNSMAALAHGMGHALGAAFHTPHGRAVSLFLPYTIEYCARDQSTPTRYIPLARFLGLPAGDEAQAAASLARAVRELQDVVGQPRTLADLGITQAALEKELDLLVANAMNDSQTVMSTRIPDERDLRRLFLAAFSGSLIDF
jgi:alcohol dehydrogenase class IV